MLIALMRFLKFQELSKLENFKTFHFLQKISTKAGGKPSTRFPPKRLVEQDSTFESFINYF